jgi:hypothetical protein
VFRALLLLIGAARRVTRTAARAKEAQGRSRGQKQEQKREFAARQAAPRKQNDLMYFNCKQNDLMYFNCKQNDLIYFNCGAVAHLRFMGSEGCSGSAAGRRATEKRFE